ncbi:MAG: hypothetical protein V4677_00585 [Bacteroidota bacterium]
MISEKTISEKIEDYTEKLKIINERINEEISRPLGLRKMQYLLFLAKERSIYEFTRNEFKSLINEK